jgi:hypothetical protein
MFFLVARELFCSRSIHFLLGGIKDTNPHAFLKSTLTLLARLTQIRNLGDEFG